MSRIPKVDSKIPKAHGARLSNFGTLFLPDSKIPKFQKPITLIPKFQKHTAQGFWAIHQGDRPYKANLQTCC
jgi:hypothetical protein